MNDLKFALRQLFKSPGFTVVALLTLALGIGANTAIFSVVDRLLVRPLPVAEPQRLALVGSARGDGNVDFEFNYPLFRDYQRDNTVFSHLTATGEASVGLGTGGATERQRALLVSGNYFAMLGVNAALGRTFAANEGVELDDAAVTVISHGLWQRSFGADPQVIGRSVTVNGHSFTVIGVAPREFTGTTRSTVPDLYVPITMFGQLNADRPGGEHPLSTRYFTWHNVMGRLKDGVSLEQAQVAMQLLTDQYNQHRPPNTPDKIALLSGAQGFTQGLRDSRLPMNLLLGTAALVLLIACANLANLQLARATGRAREFAIRLALGAGRRRVMRGLLAESVLLAMGGGLLGMLVAVWLGDVLGRFNPAGSRVEVGGALDLRVLLFAFGASVFTGILFGLAPALRASRPELVPELKGGGGTTEARAGRWNLRSLLVVFQIALSLLVLVSAGLCVRSLKKLQQLDPGFEPSRVVLMSFDLGLNNFSQPQAKAFYDRLLERVRTLPGVEAASLGFTTPLSGSSPGMSVERVDDYQAGPREHPVGDFNIVAGDYFRALGLPMLRGRDFNAADTASGPPVVIVNEAFARRYWPGQDALGKRIFQHGANGGTATEVVGVVGTTRSRRLTDAARPAFYFPFTQKPDLALTLAVRTGLEPTGTIAQLRALVKSLDGNIPVFSVRTLAEQKDGSLSLQRMAATLLGGFGVLALLLAGLGIYGVLAYSVSRRTREIGVRMALGAQVADVLELVLRQGIGLAGVGMGIGLAAAFGVTRLLRGFLYEVQPLDPVTFGSVAVLLAAVALFACWLPARRAARVDPMVALRAE
ncbi:MAG TPA: ABC transporter permease [Candidatus Limnocylindria bacterium]|jgi:predicted permease|nr:ABC transporter permease [Candidatus Limnocylindria bacterium]